MSLKTIIKIVLAMGLVSVVGFFVALGVLGGSFAGTCLSSDVATKMEGTTNREKIYNFWVNNGFSSAQAAGITANIQAESGYSPFRQETVYAWPAGGYGIAQFTGEQRRNVTTHMKERLGSTFDLYYKNQYGGGVSESKGFIPEGVSEEINDQFLSAQLEYLMTYITSFKPSSISRRTSGFTRFTGLTVPKEATLKEYMLSLDSPSDAAKAWTFLYEYPGNINMTAQDRARHAEAMHSELRNQAIGTPDTLKGACGVGNVVAPVATNDTLTVTSGVGMRTLNSRVTRVHQGIDIVGGGDIVAAISGTVIVAQNGYAGYGTTVKIDHGDGTYTLYGHMVEDSLKVKVGDTVASGQVLGTMGNSGASYGVHLHFEVWVKDERVNPFAFLAENGVAIEWASWIKPGNTKPGPF